MNGGYAYEVWPGTMLVKFVMNVGDEADTPEGWFFVPWGEPVPVPVDDPSLLEGQMQALLDAKLRQANAQVSALQGRVDAINDAIEFEEALPEEIAELPVRKAQLTLWKKYRIDLGRVKAAPGWYATPTWPTMPEPYTAETSAVAKAVQAS